MHRGALGVLALAARTAGMAPHAPHAHQRALKTLLLLYGYIIATCTSVGVMIITVSLACKSNIVRAVDIMQFCCNTLFIILMLVGGFSGRRRVERMTRIIIQLDEIEDKVSYRTKRSVKTSLRLLNISLVLCTFADVGLRIFITYDLYNPEAPLNELVTLVYFLKHYLVVTLEMHLAAFAGRVLMTLEIINESLQTLLTQQLLTHANKTSKVQVKHKIAWEEAEHDDTTHTDGTGYYIPLNQCNGETLNEDEEIEFKIRRIAASYMNISDFIEECTDADGLMMLIILVCHMLYIEQSAFDLIIKLIVNNRVDLNTIYALLLVGAQVGRLILFVEPFHRTHVQVERSQLLVQALLVHSERAAPTGELRLLLATLALQTITHCPLDVVTFTRSVVVKILGGVVTYLVISFTYVPSLCA